MKTPSQRPRLQLFERPWLEALTVVSASAFLVIWAIVLPAIFLFAFALAPSAWAPLLIVLGILLWTLAEYALHRFVFHFEARSTLLKRMIFVIHGNHHEDPNDPLRNLMPPIVSIPVGAVIWFMAVSAFGLVATWCVLGFLLGYVAYDLVHYGCHQWSMHNPFLRGLKIHHMRHHHLRAGGNYGVTAIWWDRLLSTRIKSSKERVKP